LENGYTRNQINHHLRQLKEQRSAEGRAALTKMPILALVKVKRSLLGGFASKKDQSMV
jgi:hypothetical protein